MYPQDRQALTTVAVIGPGAIGATVAAWLTQDPANAVTVCARTPFDDLRVDSPGGAITASPTVLTDPSAAMPVDWVLVATKTYDAPGAAAWLAGLVGPDTRVAVLQNGVEHLARFSPFVPPERIVPAVVDIPAERTGPGRVLQRRDGSILVPAGADGEAFAGLFAASPIAVSTTEDWTTAAWRKLCVNCAGVVSALTLKPAGVVREPGIAELMAGLIAECIAVGRAEGAALDDDVAKAVVEGYRAGPADAVNSIHADRLAGRPMELDARNGVIVRLGRKHAIATPLNAAAVALLEAMVSTGG